MSTFNKQAEDVDSYRKIFKATTLFGGVQVYQILISVIRSKFVAILLGTTGVGLMGLYLSTLQFVQSITSLGLSQSAVRDVSEANGCGDVERVGRIISAFRKLVWFTGLLGMGMVIILSPLLSKIAFGNHDYTIPFILLSCTLLINQLASGQGVILQGMRKLKDLAKASSIGATLGLIISVPIYYAIGIEGIVPTLILNSITGFIISWCFARKIRFQRMDLPVKEILQQGKWMIRMGVAMSLSGIFATAISFAIRTFIMRQGGTEAVGLYQAGFVIINSYVGMVFTAIGTDFYPRLAAVNHDKMACRNVISQQGEIATQILAPLLCGCILLMPFILRILYSDQFLDSGPYVLWCCPGMMFRLASWLIAYQFIAKAETRVYMVTEVVANCVYLLLSLIGYKCWGLTGLGIAFTVDYLIYFILVLAIAVKRYEFSYSNSFIEIYTIQLFLIAGSLATIEFFDNTLKYWISAILTLMSSLYAIIILDKKIGIINLLKKLLN